MCVCNVCWGRTVHGTTHVHSCQGSNGVVSLQPIRTRIGHQACPHWTNENTTPDQGQTDDSFNLKILREHILFLSLAEYKSADARKVGTKAADAT